MIAASVAGLFLIVNQGNRRVDRALFVLFGPLLSRCSGCCYSCCSELFRGKRNGDNHLTGKDNSKNCASEKMFLHSNSG